MPAKAAPTDVIVLEVKYAFPTLNFAHAASGKLHWKERKTTFDKCESFLIGKLLPYRGIMIERFTLELKYNSRMDVDNTAYAVKAFVDSCRYVGTIAKDDKRFFKKLSIEYDEHLNHNTYVFVLRKII